MRHGAQDETKGTFHEVKGAIKQKVGRALNKPGLEAEGQVEKIGGKLQRKLGWLERALRK